MTTHKAIREALEAGPVQYACHCDLEPGMQPDGCVLDEGKPQNCVYARVLTERGLCKTDCQEWKPINVTKPTIEVSAANLRALLADLDAKTAEVERETTARRDAQEQLYAERERHTAEVKKLQVEIGRLQALRREPMTEDDMLACMAAATHEVPARIPPGWRKVIRAVEAHHHITQKEQG